MSTIEGGADNGRLCTIDFPFYQGQAGIREFGEVIHAAYFGRRSVNAIRREGTVDGVRYRVVEAIDSKVPKGMVRLTLEAVGTAIQGVVDQANGRPVEG